MEVGGVAAQKSEPTCIPQFGYFCTCTTTFTSCTKIDCVNHQNSFARHPTSHVVTVRMLLNKDPNIVFSLQCTCAIFTQV